MAATPLSAPMTPSGRRRLGFFEAAMSGVGFGFLGVIAKMLFNAGFAPGEQLALRFLCASAVLWTYLLIARPHEVLLPWRAALKCFGLGACGYAVFSSCYFEALQGLSASLSVLLLYTYPAIVALGAWGLFKQHPGRHKLISFLPLMLGLALLVWGDLTVTHPQAVAYGLASAALYALYILVSSRWLADINPLVSVCYIQTSAALVLAAIHLNDSVRVLSLVQSYWWLILASALLCTLMPMLLFFRALQKISPAEASMLSTAEPITGVVAATIFLGEKLIFMQIIGAAAIIVALIYMAKADRVSIAGST